MIVYGRIEQVFEPRSVVSKKTGKAYVIRKSIMRYMNGDSENTILLSSIVDSDHVNDAITLTQGAYGMANVSIKVDERRYIDFHLDSFEPMREGQHGMCEGRMLNNITGIMKNVVNDRTYTDKAGKKVTVYNLVIGCCNDDASAFDMPVETAFQKAVSSASMMKGKEISVNVQYSVKKVEKNGKTYYINKCRYMNHRNAQQL